MKLITRLPHLALIWLVCAWVTGCELRSYEVDLDDTGSASLVDSDADPTLLNWPVGSRGFDAVKPTRSVFLDLVNVVDSPQRPVWSGKPVVRWEELAGENSPFSRQEVKRLRSALVEATAAMQERCTIAYDDVREPIFALSRSGESILVSGQRTRLIDTQSGAIRWTTSVSPNNQWCVYYAVDADPIWVADGANLHRISGEDGQVLETLEAPDTIRSLSHAKDTGQFLITYENGRLSLCDSETLKNSMLNNTCREPALPARINRSGRSIATWTRDGGQVIEVDGTSTTSIEAPFYAPRERAGKSTGSLLDLVVYNEAYTWICEERLFFSSPHIDRFVDMPLQWKTVAVDTHSNHYGSVLAAMERISEAGSPETVLLELGLWQSFVKQSEPNVIAPLAYPAIASNEDSSVVALPRENGIVCYDRTLWPAGDSNIFGWILTDLCSEGRFDDVALIANYVRRFPEPRLNRSGEQWFNLAVWYAGGRLEKYAEQQPRTVEEEKEFEALQRFIAAETTFSRCCELFALQRELWTETRERGWTNAFTPDEREERLEQLAKFDSLFDVEQPPLTAVVSMGKIYALLDVSDQQMANFMIRFLPMYALEYQLHDVITLWLQPNRSGNVGEVAGYFGALCDRVGGELGDFLYTQSSMNYAARNGFRVVEIGLNKSRLERGLRYGMERDLWWCQEAVSVRAMLVGRTFFTEREILEEKSSNLIEGRWPVFPHYPDGRLAAHARP